MKDEIKYSLHELIPEHEPLTPKEEEKLLNKYKITKSQLPKIKKNDMGLKIMMNSKGFKITQNMIIRIKQKNKTLNYRVVD